MKVENTPTESLPVELEYWPREMYMAMYRESRGDVEEFWEQEARELEWFRTCGGVLDWDPCMYARNSRK